MEMLLYIGSSKGNVALDRWYDKRRRPANKYPERFPKLGAEAGQKTSQSLGLKRARRARCDGGTKCRPDRPPVRRFAPTC